jgi:hypothetical protein
MNTATKYIANFYIIRHPRGWRDTHLQAGRMSATGEWGIEMAGTTRKMPGSRAGRQKTEDGKQNKYERLSPVVGQRPSDGLTGRMMMPESLAAGGSSRLDDYRARSA